MSYLVKKFLYPRTISRLSSLSSTFPSKIHHPCFFSSSTPSLSCSSSHDDGENREAKVSVWWDLENCNIPSGIHHAPKIAERITSAVRNYRLKGQISIEAFADLSLVPRARQEALTSTGVRLHNVPHDGKKNKVDMALEDRLNSWVSQSQNPPPAYIFLISGDSDFTKILDKLREKGYTILLATGTNARHVLCRTAEKVWNWYNLAKGENKHYVSKPQPNPTPKPVVHQICEILQSSKKVM